MDIQYNYFYGNKFVFILDVKKIERKIIISVDNISLQKSPFQFLPSLLAR